MYNYKIKFYKKFLSFFFQIKLVHLNFLISMNSIDFKDKLIYKKNWL